MKALVDLVAAVAALALAKSADLGMLVALKNSPKAIAHLLRCGTPSSQLVLQSMHFTPKPKREKSLAISIHALVNFLRATRRRAAHPGKSGDS